MKRKLTWQNADTQKQPKQSLEPPAFHFAETNYFDPKAIRASLCHIHISFTKTDK